MAPISKDPLSPAAEDSPAPPEGRDLFDLGPVRQRVESLIGEDAFAAGVPPPFELNDSSVPRIPFSVEGGHGLPETFIPPRIPRDRVWLHATLFLLTLATTTIIGISHYLAWRADFRAMTTLSLSWSVIAQGLWYSLTILGILGSHELGHYFACVYYRVNASLPFFLPLPPIEPFMTGTLGAFIKIREPIRSKRALFDIGIAGPLAGFIVAVPTLFVGVVLSNVVPLPADRSGLIDVGEPLLFKAFSWMVFGHVPDGYSVNMHPMAFAAWFGLLATTLNLFPIGQLDGGHISYAVLGRRSTKVTLGAIGVAIALTFFSMSWALWTVVMLVLLAMFGLRHPPTMDDDQPLDRTRMLLAIVAVIVFVLCFTPAPLSMPDVIKP